MSKQLSFNYNDKEYTLTFNKATVKRLQEDGFVIEQLGTKPNVMIPMLFNGALQAKHKFLKQEDRDAIWNTMGDKDKLVSALIEMYLEPVTALMENPEGEKNLISWEVNFEMKSEE